MKRSEIEFIIEDMIEDVNDCSRRAENAKAMNLPMIEQNYFSRILGLYRLMLHLGYTLEHDGKRADREDGVGGIEYMHYKAIKR
ncbi:MAG: hypothetical protein SO161_04960 [Treponema sp.]|nr:hypothetical protein [Treponema sp.]